jgi:hypothetical protein
VGTYLSTYAVDLEKLAAAFGSKSKALVRRAVAGPHVDDNASWFKRQIEAGAPRLDQAITELVDEKITKPKHGFQYVYGIEALARVLGASVGDELKMGSWIDDILDPLLKKVGGKPFCKAMHLDVQKLPMRVPTPKEEPFCTALPPADVATFLGALARVATRIGKDPPDVETAETLDYVLGELNTRLRGASRRRRGLVSFLY